MQTDGMSLLSSSVDKISSPFPPSPRLVSILCTSFSASSWFAVSLVTGESTGSIGAHPLPDLQLSSSSLPMVNFNPPQMALTDV